MQNRPKAFKEEEKRYIIGKKHITFFGKYRIGNDLQQPSTIQ